MFVTRDLKTHIGDRLHFDTPAQNEIGKRFAAKLDKREPSRIAQKE